MKIGFLGAGTITAAMVEGLLRSHDRTEAIFLSPRNRETAARLAALSDRITVEKDNQSVLDRSDVVVLAVRPQIASDVLKELTFHERHHVISVMAMLDLDWLRQALGPARRMTRAVPLPFVATNSGVTAFYPPDPIAHDLFTALGTAIETDSETQFETFAIASALMGTYFQLLGDCNDWLSAQGLDTAKARTYLSELFASLSRVAMAAPHKDFQALRDEFSTAGGINELAAGIFRSQGGSQAIRNALEGIRLRIADASRAGRDGKRPAR